MAHKCELYLAADQEKQLSQYEGLIKTATNINDALHVTLIVTAALLLVCDNMSYWNYCHKGQHNVRVIILS